MRNGRGDKIDGSGSGVVGIPAGVGSVVLEARAATTVGEGVENKRELGFEEEFTSSSSTLFHNAWRVKGIIPSILQPVMFFSLSKAISHTGFKHFMKCS